MFPHGNKYDHKSDCNLHNVLLCNVRTCYDHGALTHQAKSAYCYSRFHITWRSIPGKHSVETILLLTLLSRGNIVIDKTYTVAAATKNTIKTSLLIHPTFTINARTPRLSGVDVCGWLVQWRHAACLCLSLSCEERLSALWLQQAILWRLAVKLHALKRDEIARRHPLIFNHRSRSVIVHN